MGQEIDAKDVFRLEDFQSIQLSVQFQNLTTKTEIREPNSISLVEVLERSLVFEMPATSCNVKHSVLASIKKKLPGRERKFEPLLNFTGKVATVEPQDNQLIRVTIDCVQFDEASWNDLLQLFSTRQKEIEGFFAAAKGN
jgi:hypothetical protein